MTMIKGYVINYTSNLIFCASRLAWGREENLRQGNTASNSLKDALAVKHMDTDMPLTVNIFVLYQSRLGWYLHLHTMHSLETGKTEGVLDLVS